MKTISAVPVFQVKEIESALRFYTEVLGFTEEFRFGNYAGLKLGEVALHLSLPGDYQRPVGGGTAYVFCDSVDEYFAAITSRGAKPITAPSDAHYGMRDFVMHDPDGNQISFGCDLEAE